MALLHRSDPSVRQLDSSAGASVLGSLATILDQRFLHTDGTPAEVFAAYAADHGRALAGP
ncbi:hypothetical protein [Nonomuraea jabiensis]|uniref:Uncharacterized protein n=1 Tax=Nonomuraea jabiensis TaxID=882448 RepID=A0A7W9GBK7_9ACTN|nr:hypothetical protein [Nonomuraea jabiensis]MBB5780789.1 hypothetical protein [Nonomuraea jabiensis]